MSGVPPGDPTADWFRRHRAKFAWTAWILFGLLPLLVAVAFDPNGRDITNAVGRALFFGALSWSWGSKQDRTTTPYWRTLSIVWAVLLVIYLGFAVAAIVRTGSIQTATVIGIVILVMLLAAAVFPYRRIKAGGPWPPEPRHR